MGSGDGACGGEIEPRFIGFKKDYNEIAGVLYTGYFIFEKVNL